MRLLYNPNSNKSILWKKKSRENNYEFIVTNNKYKSFDINKNIRNRLYKQYATSKKHYTRLMTNGKISNISKRNYNSSSNSENPTIKRFSPNLMRSPLKLNKSIGTLFLFY